MLVELAIGDAYGAGFEYAEPDLVWRDNTLDAYLPHQLGTIPAGHYTDDTQMSLAIAEALVAGAPWTPEHLAGRFVEVFKRDQRHGYSKHFYRLLDSVADGRELLARIDPRSDRSGAAMRATPIGIVADHAEVIARAQVQAAITHDTPDGVDAAVAAALATHYFVYRLGPKAGLGRYLASRVRGPWDRPWSGAVGAQGWMSVQAAVTALIQSATLSETLRRAVAWTGDVDTVATIALAAGSWSDELAQDLPAHLCDGLERGPYGYEYLRDLDGRLKSLRGRAG